MITTITIMAVLTVWMLLGWLVVTVGCYVNDYFYEEVETEPGMTFILAAFWPFLTVWLVGSAIIKNFNPLDIVDTMRDRRERRKSVIVKPRRFRGKED